MATHQPHADAIPKSLIILSTLVGLVLVAACLGLVLAFGSYWLKPTVQTVAPTTNAADTDVESPPAIESSTRTTTSAKI
jgi:hypothetical protein